MNALPDQPAATQSMQAFLWRLVLYTHLVSAALWWWLVPGGFPPTHARFWTNEVFPFVVCAVCMTALWAERKGAPVLRATAGLTIPVFWSAATIVAVALFPYSAGRFGFPAFVCLTAMSTVFWLSFRRKPFPLRRGALAVIPAVVTGFGFVWALRGGEPDTSPLNVSLPEFEGNVDMRLAMIPIHLSDGVDVQTVEGRVLVRHSVPTEKSAGSGDSPNHRQEARSMPERRYRIEVEPLLSFETRSPDRFWTILSPARYRASPPRRLTALRCEEHSLSAQYHDDTDLVLHVGTSETDDVMTIEAITRLERPIYSHLNSFVALTIYGCRKPAISFSPCATALVDVEPFDYPVGRPMRLAYVDADEILHVVSARSGEKGPFTEFGRGSLLRSEPLTITIFDARTAIFRISLDDWAAQTGRSLSPTAGWGLPVNAIEFSQIGESDSGAGPVAIWVTLAGTSVGRGWDSVGHAAGTYRNRVRIEAIDR